jgi:uncharacterized protein involved in type VI secretion and phage assembly
MDDDKRFYGKYRGTVLSNTDPEQRGRLLVQVPDVGGVLPTSWALPCLPFAGPAHGFYAVPPVRAAVWVEFEHGDPAYPIWTGCFWDTPATIPPQALAGAGGVEQVVVQTVGQATLLISDIPGPAGGIMLRTPTAMLSISSAGIILNNGQGATITMLGNAVQINGTALVVT